MVGIYNGRLVADARMIHGLLGQIKYRQISLRGGIVPIPGRSGLIDLTASSSEVSEAVFGSVMQVQGVRPDTLYRLTMVKQD